MNKKLILFLILSFLSLQTFSFLHQAEFGFEEHEHDDDVCEIYLYCEQSKDNIQGIVGTNVEIGGVELRPNGCAWNPEKGWHRP